MQINPVKQIGKSARHENEATRHPEPGHKHEQNNGYENIGGIAVEFLKKPVHTRAGHCSTSVYHIPAASGASITADRAPLLQKSLTVGELRIENRAGCGTPSRVM